MNFYITNTVLSSQLHISGYSVANLQLSLNISSNILLNYVTNTASISNRLNIQTRLSCRLADSSVSVCICERDDSARAESSSTREPRVSWARYPGPGLLGQNKITSNSYLSMLNNDVENLTTNLSILNTDLSNDYVNYYSE